MRSVRYGSKVIEYTIEERNELKSHYISVEKHVGVVLKGKAVAGDVADRLILKKAKWILEKLEVVKAVDKEEVVTGSRIAYLGKSYYAQVVVDASVEGVGVAGVGIAGVRIAFNHSKFVITVKSSDVGQEEIEAALERFYKEKAVEKIGPRVERLAKKTGLAYKGLQFRKMSKRWGSCTGSNRIILNTEAVKLPFSLIDYLIVHELVHTVVKDHSKAFWAELGKYERRWKELDGRMRGMRM